MHDSLKKVRFSIKPSMIEKGRSLELARTLPVHPLTYQELPFDPEYSQYAGRLTTEKLSNATPDEMYWKTRQDLILRHTGEYPYEVAGPDALKLLQKIFPRDISKVNVGRCSYQFACYHDGGMITDGLLLRIEENKFWFAQADGDLFSWYKANAHRLNVNITDPDVWVSQVQGPKSMELLDHLIDEGIAKTWKYFDWTTVTIKGEKLIISRTGFTNELGWELYLRPENNAELIGDLILEEGKKMGMILTATPSFRGRRIEAGLLSAGQDFDKNTNPFSVGLGKFVYLEKENFIGKESLVAADKNCKTW